MTNFNLLKIIDIESTVLEQNRLTPTFWGRIDVFGLNDFHRAFFESFRDFHKLHWLKKQLQCIRKMYFLFLLQLFPITLLVVIFYS